MKNNRTNYYFSSFFIIATLMMSIGYASINSISSNIDVELLAEVQDGVFISEINYKSSISAEATASKINNAIGTTISSNIVLTNNENSSITYEISLYNSTNKKYYFAGIDYLVGENTYSNENITFKLEGLNEFDSIESKELKKITITFYHKDSTITDNLELKSLLNLKFIEAYIVTYNANGGYFSDGSDTNITGYSYAKEKFTKISKSHNVSDDGKTYTKYDNYLGITDKITIPGATSLTVTVTYQTAHSMSDWVSVYSGTVTPTASNYGSSISGRLGGTTKQTKTYTISGDTVQFYFKTSSGIATYYGYYATVTGYGDSYSISMGNYEEVQQDDENLTFLGWYTNEECTEGNEFVPSSLTSDITVYAKWKDIREIFAIYSADDTSLDFYYNIPPTAGDSYNGKTATVVYRDFANKDNSTLPWDSYKTTITNVSVVDEISPTSTYRWFYYFQKCTSFDLGNLNTDDVTNMAYMFYYAGQNTLTITGLENWNTSNVTNMAYMFGYAGYNVSEFSLPGIENWNTSKVKSMNNMFYYAASNSGVTSFILDLSNWDTQNVTSFSSMFRDSGRYATTFQIGDLSNWNTSKVTSMYQMFYYVAFQKKTVFNIGNLSNWDTSNVINMSYMFACSGNVTSWYIGNISNWNTSKVTNMSYMFQSSGYSWNIGNLSNWDTSKVTNMSYMFYGAFPYSGIFTGIENWNTSNVTNMSYMFAHIGSYANTFSLNLTSWDTSKVTNMSYMFQKVGGMNVDHSAYSLNLNNWNVSNVTNMTYMFEGFGYEASNITLDISNWDTSKVTNMSYMFYQFGRSNAGPNSKIIGLENLNTSNVTNMSYMFNRIFADNGNFDVDFSTWDVSKVTNMSSMFDWCAADGKFNVVGLDKWNVSNVTNMSYMFQYAGYNGSFNIADISVWDTSKVTNMSYMFRSAGRNTEYTLDLSGWNVGKVTSHTEFNADVTGKVIAPTWVN